MTLYELMSWWRSVPFPYDTQIDSNGAHLLSDGVRPQCVSISLVKCHGLLSSIWAFYTKLHRPLDILLCTALLCIRDNYVSSPYHVLFPPVEIRLMINLLQD